jgi:hypothetical protein
MLGMAEINAIPAIFLALLCLVVGVGQLSHANLTYRRFLAWKAFDRFAQAEAKRAIEGSSELLARIRRERQ